MNWESYENALLRDLKEQHDIAVAKCESFNSEAAKATMGASIISTLNLIAMAEFATEALRAVLHESEEISRAIWAIADNLSEGSGEDGES